MTNDFLTRLVESLVKKKITCATAESCTGGLVAKLLTDIPGSSGTFKMGVVTYSNDAKVFLLGVDRKTLETHGAVSQETAIQMASGLARLSEADICIATTGIAGPGGGSESKPVGTVFICAAINPRFNRDKKPRTTVEYFVFKGDRSNIRNSASKQALLMIEQSLLKIQENIKGD